jgi:hypothetical protein
LAVYRVLDLDPSGCFRLIPPTTELGDNTLKILFAYGSEQINNMGGDMVYVQHRRSTSERASHLLAI